jgi:rhamnose transport system substrate-binding protein
MHLNPSSNALIGNTIIKLAADHLPEGGDVAILSASATATNQNTWIEEAKKVLPNYPGINVVGTVYGDDLADKSYREAQGLMQTYPNLKAIIAPTTVGILAAAQAVTDAGKIGQVNVTGLGLPSEMAGAREARARRSPSRSGTRSTWAMPPR